MKKLFFLFILFSVNLHSQNEFVCPIQDSNYWKDKFDYRLGNAPYSYNTTFNTSQDYYGWATHNSRTNTSDEKYYLAYYIDAFATMYDATGDTEYLDRAIILIRNVIRSSRVISTIPNITSTYHSSDSPPNFYKGWLSGDGSSDNLKEGVLNEVFLFRYVTKLLRIMKKNNVHEDILYYKDYARILDFTEKHIWDKWYKRCYENTPQRWVYLETTHMASHWAYLALNLNYVSNKNNCQYLEVFNNISYKGFPHNTTMNGTNNYNIKGASLRSQVDYNSAIYQNFSWIHMTWDQILDSTGIQNYIQDVSHANAVIALIDESYLLGMHWNEGDINDMVNFAKNVVIDNNGFTDNFLNCPPPSIAVPICVGALGSGFDQADGFIKLGKYDCDLQAEYENRLVQMISFLPHLTELNTYAQLCLNAKYLLSPEVQVSDNFSESFFPVNTNNFSIKSGNYKTNQGNRDEVVVLNHKNNRTFKANVLNMENLSDGISKESKWWTSLDTNTEYNFENVIETVSGDFNGDGNDDVAVFYKNGNNMEIRVLNSNGINEFTPTGVSVVWSSTSLDSSRIIGTTVTGNFKGDGKDEILIMYKTGSFSFEFYLFEMNNNIFTLSNPGQYNIGGYDIDKIKNRLTSGNYDGIGNDELATFYDYGTSTERHIMKYNQSTDKFDGVSVLQPTAIQTLNANMFSGRVVSGNFFGDSKDDISILYKTGNGTSQLITFISGLTNLNSTYNLSLNNNFNADNFTYKMVSGNFGGTDKDDIILFQSTSNSEFEIIKLFSKILIQKQYGAIVLVILIVYLLNCNKILTILTLPKILLFKNLRKV
jgi:hypothetical protein